MSAKRKTAAAISTGGDGARLQLAAKRCEQRTKAKAATEFLPCKGASDGLTPRCRSCIRENGRRDLAAHDAKKAARETARTAKSVLLSNSLTDANRKKLSTNTPAGEKHCRTCKTVKELDQFKANTLSKDGHRHDCRSCVAEGKTKKRNRPERVRQSSPERRAAKQQKLKAWRKQHPEAARARGALKEALARGIVARPQRCQVKKCKGPASQGHHADYRHRLAVLWVCPRHHRLIHAGEQVELIKGLPIGLAGIPPELR